MVESEAKELSEEIMLGAVTFGFEQFQPVIRAIIELAELCAKEPWNLPVAAPEAEAVAKRLAEVSQGDLRTAYNETAKQARTEKVAAVKAKAAETLVAEGLPAELVGKKFKVAGAGDRARRDPGDRPAHRRPRHQDRASDRMPDRRPAAGPWLGPLHPGRDPGSRGHHAGHRRG
jgi:Polyribonucleotide nucleotidyltransferase (polynucleotide phosphorylase)